MPGFFIQKPLIPYALLLFNDSTEHIYHNHYESGMRNLHVLTMYTTFNTFHNNDKTNQIMKIN